MLLSPARRALPCSVPMYRPFGRPRSADVLAEFNPTLATKVIKVLFMDSGDIFKALQSAGGHHSQNQGIIIQLHLIDSCPINLARNILLLKILSSSSFSPEEDEDWINFLLNVWYGSIWTAGTKQLFEIEVRELLDGNLPTCMEPLPIGSLDILKTIWTGWLKLTEPVKVVEDQHISFVLTEAFDNRDHNAVYVQMGIDTFPLQLRETILQDSKRFFSSVHQQFKVPSFNGFSAEDAPETDNHVYVNPTLIDPETERWRVENNTCPFSSYLPFVLEELDSSANEGIIIRYCHRVLKKILVAFHSRKANVEFAFHLGDPLEIVYQPSLVRFDVVDCSILADKAGLANALNAGGRRLSDQPESLLLAESSAWNSLGVASVVDYVETSLCAPLSMLPTIYGLRLTNPIQQELIPVSCPVRMMWRRTPNYDNFGDADLNPSLQPFLSQLAKKCFQLDGSNWPVNERCGLKNYTSSTWIYTVRSIEERLGRGHQELPQCLLPSEISALPQFRLACRISRIWSLHSKLHLLATTKDSLTSEQTDSVLRVKSEIPSIQIVFGELPLPMEWASVTEFPLVRLTLVPALDVSETPHNVHYIDTVDIRLVKKIGEESKLRVSFLLPSDHTLDETHCAILVDFSTQKPLIDFGPLMNLKREPFDVLQPFAVGGQSFLRALMPPLPVTEPRMVVEELLETENHYFVLVRVNSDGSLKGFSTSTDHSSLSHWIDLKFRSPSTLPHLTLTVPHPFKVESSKFERSLRTITLILKKKVMVPWPGESVRRIKWKTDELKEWPNVGPVGDERIHLDSQFPSNEFATDLKTDVLNGVRYIISALFELAMKHGDEFITIRRSTDRSWMPDLWLRVHLPVRCSARGSPILLLSAYDQQLATRLLSKKKLEEHRDESDLDRIYIDPMKSAAQSSASLVISGTREAELFRSILHLNSNQIMPTEWQTKHLPRGKNSPWFPTFVSPLYADRPRNLNSPTALKTTVRFPSVSPLLSQMDTPPPDEEEMLMPIESVGGQRCAHCRKPTPSQKLKKCPRCQITRYCTMKCQRADANSHKASCPSTSKTRRS